LGFSARVVPCLFGLAFIFTGNRFGCVAQILGRFPCMHFAALELIARSRSSICFVFFSHGVLQIEFVVLTIRALPILSKSQAECQPVVALAKAGRSYCQSVSHPYCSLNIMR